MKGVGKYELIRKGFRKGERMKGGEKDEGRRKV